MFFSAHNKNWITIETYGDVSKKKKGKKEHRFEQLRINCYIA